MLSFLQKDTSFPAGSKSLKSPGDTDAAGPRTHFENHGAILPWAGSPLPTLANPCKMGINYLPFLPCFRSPPLKLGVLVMVIGRWLNSWIPSSYPTPFLQAGMRSHLSICYPFLSLSLQIRDGDSSGNMEGSLQAASGISTQTPPTILCSPWKSGSCRNSGRARWSYSTDLPGHVDSENQGPYTLYLNI